MDQEKATSMAEEAAAEEASSAQDTAEAVSEESEAMPIIFADEDFDANDEAYAAELAGRKNTIAGNIQEQPRYQKPKLPFKEAVANFFYHNKSKLLIGLVIAAMLAVVIYQSIPEKYDYVFIVFSSNYYFDDQGLQQLADNLERYGEDLDGDGEVKVHALYFDTNTQDYNEVMVARVYMAEELRKQHEAYLIMTDKVHYDAIVDVENGFGEGIFDDWKGCGKWIDIQDTDLVFPNDYVYPTAPDIDTGLGLSLVAMDDNAAKKEKLVERRANAEKMLDRILEAYPQLASSAD